MFLVGMIPGVCADGVTPPLEKGFKKGLKGLNKWKGEAGFV